MSNNIEAIEATYPVGHEWIVGVSREGEVSATSIVEYCTNDAGERLAIMSRKTSSGKPYSVSIAVLELPNYLGECFYTVFQDVQSMHRYALIHAEYEAEVAAEAAAEAADIAKYRGFLDNMSSMQAGRARATLSRVYLYGGKAKSRRDYVLETYHDTDLEYSTKIQAEFAAYLRGLEENQGAFV